MRKNLTLNAVDENVVAFKSIVCYRTGLDISTSDLTDLDVLEPALLNLLELFVTTGKIRLAEKSLNDYLVCLALEAAGEHGIPGKQPNPSYWAT